MTYSETIAYLYDKLPVFQKIGKAAIKPKLTNIILLCEALGNPQNSFKSIHVGGTNGKGSSSHFLASILQEHGLKVGLYTSPHLKDFRERLKINGLEAPESYIIDFVAQYKELIARIEPSFFEVSVAMAFKYFNDQEIDIAIIEVGLGGRYDSTNVITPILSLITNIGLDHQDILGDTLQKIASEKAGIIKKGVPVIISEFDIETASEFIDEAKLKNAPIRFASTTIFAEKQKIEIDCLDFVINDVLTEKKLTIASGLLGTYQLNNIIGVYATIMQLNQLGFNVSETEIQAGINKVLLNTNLKGRWQKLSEKPLTICDTGHNEHALVLTTQRINGIKAVKKHIILGFVKDKDIKKVMGLFPKNAFYYFCTFDSLRSLKIEDLEKIALDNNLQASYYGDVNEAIAEANKTANINDFIFIGGSTYLVAEINNL
jgi:dihydrofolate synthase / folylpolyglutamate synthase